ncbi:hypothetical protein ONZ45_g7289 [Pleurotus djamor]|nr:hypothetical protein ONZ45_g7289 [Pleurotus djamor]
MDWHPKNVMLTTLFLATKTTNNPISLEAFTTNIPKTAPADVLDLEFLVAQSLEFEFAVWHAHRALWGIVLDIQSLPSSENGDDPSPIQIYDQALVHVRESRLTDAELLYTPSQIALAAVGIVAPEMASRWSQSKLSSLGSTVPLNAFNASIDELKNLITAFGHPPNVEDVRDIDKRLRICKNPEKVVGSKAYLAKKAEEERKAEEKRNKKAEQIQINLAQGGDPFSGEDGTRKAALVDYDDDDDDD